MLLQRTIVMISCPLVAMRVLLGSAEPLREMFSPSPWLDFYDDYFLVNAYGVFSFINSKRIVVLLEYTHDGRDWFPLDLPALPGSMERMPAFVTPYHYRLDWQAWIETTARMERLPSDTWLAKGLPKFLQVLVAKLLAGDTQAASLLASPPAALFQSGRPPKAVRATPYLYSFSGFAQLLHGQWWTREPLFSNAGAEAVVYDEPWAEQVSHLPPWRDWALLFIIFWLVVSVLPLLHFGRPSDVFEQALYACFGMWALLLCMLTSSDVLPAWAACWCAGAVVGGLATYMARRTEALALKVLEPEEQALSAFLCTVASIAAFSLVFSSKFWAAIVLLVLASATMVALLVWLARQGRTDWLLTASVQLSVAALAAAIQAATFYAPVKP